MPHEWPRPPVSKICRTLSSASSKPWHLKTASTTPSFSVEYRILLADVGFFDEEERLVGGKGEAGFGGDGGGRAGDGVGGAPALLIPVGPLQQLLSPAALTR